MELTKLEKELMKDDTLYNLVCYLRDSGIQLKTIKRAVSVLDEGIDISAFSVRNEDIFNTKQRKLIALCKKKGGFMKTFVENVERQGWISPKQEAVMHKATITRYPIFADTRMVYREKTAQELRDEIEQERIDAQMLEAMGHDYDHNSFSVN